MATDVQARETGGSAMAIALVALVLLVIGAFAFFGMGNRTVETPTSTTVVTQPQAPDVNIQAPSAPPVIVGGGSSGGSSGGTSGGSSGGTSGGSSAP